MATTARIASQTLTTGQYVDGVAFSTAGVGVVTIQLIAAQVGAVLSQARVLVFDSDSGNKLDSIVIDGSDTKTIEVEPAPLNCRVSMECLAGTATVAVNQLTGGDQEGFVAGAFDATFCASVFANGAIPGAKLATGPFSLDSVLADPGNGGAIAVTTSGHCDLNIAGGGHNRNMAAPTIEGQVIKISHTAGANAGTVTIATGIDVAGNTVLNFVAAVGQSITLIANDVGAGVFRWRVLEQTQGIPVYVPLIADPGAGAAIAVTMSGICYINIAAPADNRSLAAPTWDGQVIKIAHNAGNNAGTVTVTNGFSRAGATVLNFISAATEVQEITLVGQLITGAGLRWRVLEDTNLFPVSTLITDPGNGNAIPITYDDGVCYLNIAGGGHNRSLAAPSYEGQKLTLVHNAGNNAGTVTVTNGFCTGGATVLNFVSAATEQQAITLVGATTAAGLRWRVLCDQNRIQPSREVTDPGNGGNIPVTYDHGICRINIAVAAHNRGLPNPTYEGQTLILIHNAGANAGTVTGASDLTDTGGQDVLNFTATLTEYVKAVSVGGVWRITENPDALVIS